MVETVQGDAFARLYPREYYAKFIEQSMRPDGRSLTQERHITIARDVISCTDSSALVKVGRSSGLAGVKLEVAQPDDERPGKGSIVIQVEMPPLCSSSSRPGRVSPEASRLTETLNDFFESEEVCDLSQLAIAGGKAVWVVYCDVYVLDADGSLPDVCLLAALAALQGLTLPSAEVNDSGNVVASAQPTPSDGLAGQTLQLGPLPTPLTCGVFEKHLVVDPCGEEEVLMDSLFHVLVGKDGSLAGFNKPGGVGLGKQQLQEAISAARRRQAELEL